MLTFIKHAECLARLLDSLAASLSYSMLKYMDVFHLSR